MKRTLAFITLLAPFYGSNGNETIRVYDDLRNAWPRVLYDTALSVGTAITLRYGVPFALQKSPFPFLDKAANYFTSKTSMFSAGLLFGLLTGQNLTRPLAKIENGVCKGIDENVRYLKLPVSVTSKTAGQHLVCTLCEMLFKRP